jgi:hypothetical protein
MAQRIEQGRNFRCLVCAARVGQLVPFCEWCGAKHSIGAGELVLTGAICQECGFQGPLPFARCPQCQESCRIICPACTTALAVRQNCPRCGLHFMFFDKVRRERSRACSHPRATRMSIATRKLMFLALVLAAGAPLAMGHEGRWFALGFVIALIGALFVRSGALRFPKLRRNKGAGDDLTAVMETYDAAKAVAVRALLRLNAIPAETIRVASREGASSPPGGLRRIMVARQNLARAAACLTEHGFEPASSACTQRAPAHRWGLRLVHSASTGGRIRRENRDD